MRLLEYTVLPVIWAGLLLAALSMGDMQVLNQHSICGPWGCGPPTNALVAIHVAWAVVLWPSSFYLSWRVRLPRPVVKTVSTVMIMVGLSGLVGIVVWQWAVWLPNTSDWAAEYIWQRCGFAIATASDWPLFQLLFAGTLVKGIQPAIRGAEAPKLDVAE
ncbi:MAG: hypothetical protein ABJZ55_11780 [Fuerstiella sp.]